MKVAVGTSGFAYKEWKGSFYPADLKDADFLRFYASRLETVEINNTFYRMPKEVLLAGWAKQVPDDFTFILKAPQRITHMKRLKDAGEDADFFVRTAGVLGTKLGPTLFQLPPNMKQDLPRLEAFLATLPRTWRAAFEFRHPSWFNDATWDVLRAHGAALVAAEADAEDGGEAIPAPVVPTTTWGYLRLRRMHYTEADLRAWADKVLTQPWEFACVFFKHEDEGTGPRLAEQFMPMVKAGAA